MKAGGRSAGRTRLIKQESLRYRRMESVHQVKLNRAVHRREALTRRRRVRRGHQSRVEPAEVAHDPANVPVVEHADEERNVAQPRLRKQ